MANWAQFNEWVKQKIQSKTQKTKLQVQNDYSEDEELEFSEGEE